MVYEATTTLAPSDVFGHAKRFFADRLPLYAAFPERESASHLVLRGQGGEEIVIAAVSDGIVTRVRGSTLLFDQPLGRFMTTLPPTPDAVPA